jgi:hypothetical protein
MSGAAGEMRGEGCVSASGFENTVERLLDRKFTVKPLNKVFKTDGCGFDAVIYFPDFFAHGGTLSGFQTLEKKYALSSKGNAAVSL